MWEPLKDDDGHRVSAIDEETGDVFYIAQAVIAFVCFDPKDGTWHDSSMQIGIDTIRHMVPGKQTYIGQHPSTRIANRACPWTGN